MRLITGQDEIIANFVSSGLGRQIHPPYVAMGWVAVDRAGNWRLVSGAVFNDYHGASIEISFYGRVTRQACREIYSYVFGQLKCLRLTARTRHGNTAVRNMLPQHGWVFEGCLKQFYGSAKSNNALIYRLEAETAQRWINGLCTVASDPSQSVPGLAAAAADQHSDGAAAGRIEQCQSVQSAGQPAI